MAALAPLSPIMAGSQPLSRSGLGFSRAALCLQFCMSLPASRWPHTRKALQHRACIALSCCLWVGQRPFFTNMLMTQRCMCARALTRASLTGPSRCSAELAGPWSSPASRRVWRFARQRMGTPFLAYSPSLGSLLSRAPSLSCIWGCCWGVIRRPMRRRLHRPRRTHAAPRAALHAHRPGVSRQGLHS